MALLACPPVRSGIRGLDINGFNRYRYAGFDGFFYTWVSCGFDMCLGLGFRFQGSGFRVEGLGFRVEGLGLGSIHLGELRVRWVLGDVELDFEAALVVGGDRGRPCVSYMSVTCHLNVNYVSVTCQPLLCAVIEAGPASVTCN